MAECNINTVFGNNFVGIYFLEPSQGSEANAEMLWRVSLKTIQ